MNNIDLQLIEQGLIKNLHDAVLHSFDHLYQYKQAGTTSDLKWSVISIVQAGELICNALLIKGGCPVEKLVRKKVFYARSFNQELLNLLQEHCKQSLSITDREVNLLRNIERLADTRNELMHRTLSLPDDKIAYAKAALVILLVFEQRYRLITFPECEGEEHTIDQAVISLLPWLGGEKDRFFKEANEYLKEKDAAHGYLNCPQCGGYYVTEEKCRVCRVQLKLIECLGCGYKSYELLEEVNLDCPECGSNI
jgi:predicted RNA-binding Zn-ribbon protein involved in translation (DUF1610 family)